MRFVLVCLAVSCCLASGQADAEAPRAYLGFAAGLTAVGPGLGDEFWPGGTMETFVGLVWPDSTTIRLGMHWLVFGLRRGERVSGWGYPGYGRPVDGSMDDTEAIHVTDVRVTVLWRDKGSGRVRGYAGSGLGVVRMSFEDDPAQWGCVISPTIGMRIRGGAFNLSLETGVEMVFTQGTRFGSVPVRVVFPF